MATIYKYRIYCSTDSKYEYQWNEEEPNKCPVNTSHSINTGLTTIVEIREPNLITIKEEDTPTGGHFCTEVVKIEATANVITTVDSSWPFPITGLLVSFITNDTHEGDSVDIAVAPDTIIGAITSNMTSGNVIANVQQSVIDNISVGFYVTLWDGVNTHNCGRVINKNTVDKQITIEIPTTTDFLITRTTYVKITPYYVKNFELGPPWKYDFGTSKIGGTYIPSNTIVRVLYHNTSPETDKIIRAQVEYLY
jgi:hypothetical protein